MRKRRLSINRSMLAQRKALKIKRAFGIFNRDALHCMSVNHGGPYSTMAQQLLNRPNIIIPLEQMAGKAVAKRIGGRTLTNSCLFHRLFYRLLHMRFMQMISPVFSGLILLGQLFG